MRNALSLCPRNSWPPDSVVDEVTLDFDTRHRRRIRVVGNNGTDLLIDLAEATPMADGDGLTLEGGGVVVVRAASESLLEVKSSSAEGLARLAWHLGNRHLPVQILENCLRLRADHVIAAMLTGLGAEVRAIDAPFNSEGGAYASHGHSHSGKSHSHD
jgi:urease accessory protein